MSRPMKNDNDMLHSQHTVLSTHHKYSNIFLLKRQYLIKGLPNDKSLIFSYTQSSSLRRLTAYLTLLNYWARFSHFYSY